MIKISEQGLGQEEEFKPGHKRIVLNPRPGVFSLAIAHRTSEALNLWSDWSWWGNGKSKEEVISRHNSVVSTLAR